MNIYLEDISFSYNKEHQIFNKIDLTLNSDEITILMGANGSGKTTFCRLLSGLEKCHNGKLHFDNENINDIQRKDISQQIAYLKQEPLANIIAASPDEDLSIYQHKFKSYDDHNQEIRSKALRSFHIDELSDKPIWELSSGQIKRVGLSSLLLNYDKYWILDEPLSSVDDRIISYFIKLLKQRKKEGLGALIVTHRDQIFKKIKDNILLIKKNQILRI